MVTNYIKSSLLRSTWGISKARWTGLLGLASKYVPHHLSSGMCILRKCGLQAKSGQQLNQAWFSIYTPNKVMQRRMLIKRKQLG